MLLSAVSVFVVAQSSSEIPKELMNNPVDKIRNENEASLGHRFIFQWVARRSKRAV